MSYSIEQDGRGVYYQLETPSFVRGPGGKFIEYNLAVMNAANMAYQDLLQRLRERAKRTFQKGQAKWPELDPKYKAWKVKHGMSSQKLVATGQLKQSLTGKTNLSITEMGRWRGGFKIKYGTKRPYAYTHQFGTGNMPKRRFLNLIGARGDAPYFISRYNAYLNMMSPKGGAAGGMGGMVGGGAYSGYEGIFGGFMGVAMLSLGLISGLMGGF